MLNKEKFAKEIIEIATSGGTLGVADGKPCVCGMENCNDCDFHPGTCVDQLEKWANSEYKEFEIDWYKVPVDTPVFVWDAFTINKQKRYYAGLKNGYYMAFDYGATSWSFSGERTLWHNCELARKEDIQKYRKR